MPIRIAPTMDDVSLMRRAAAPGSERRAHARVRFTARAHVRGGIGTLEAFEDFANSVDITREGLLISTARGNYWVGQALQVTCPYCASGPQLDAARRSARCSSAIRRSMWQRQLRGRDACARSQSHTHIVRGIRSEVRERHTRSSTKRRLSSSVRLHRASSAVDPFHGSSRRDPRGSGRQRFLRPRSLRGRQER
jgi:hypothetical protein